MSVSRALLFVASVTLATSASAALQLPATVTSEATSAAGAAVHYSAAGSGVGDDENGRPTQHVSCAPASGSTFAIGSTTVTCSSGEESGTFTVQVVDTTAPALDLPRDFSVAGTDSGAIVTYTAKAKDVVDGDVSVSCSPASGTTFAAGATNVQCTSADSRGNAATGSFVVTVLVQPPPPPVLSDITREATGPNGAVVNYTASGSGDDENGRPTQSATCSPVSGSTFPLGETAVTCSNGGAFKVTIVDTTAPALLLPGNIVTQDPIVTYTASAQDLVDGSVLLTCTPASGSTFPIGTTLVQCSASDTRGNAASGSFTVTVQDSTQPDTEAPTIVSISASPDVIKPPNGKLVTVTVTVGVIDNLDDAPLVRIYDVTSNEGIGTGDFEITAPLTVDLRAERDPQGEGRVYTLSVEAIDAAGNRSTASVPVVVPHDSGSTSAPGTTETPKKRRAARG